LNAGVINNIWNVVKTKGNAKRIRVYDQSGCGNECSSQQMQEGSGMPFASGFQRTPFCHFFGFLVSLRLSHPYFSARLLREKTSEKQLTVCSYIFDPKNSPCFESKKCGLLHLS
jgi:hypothetical protein